MTKVDGGDSILGVLAAIGLCAAAGGILALPALRLRGSTWRWPRWPSPP